VWLVWSVIYHIQLYVEVDDGEMGDVSYKT
jgi:hypothetical protein